MSSPPSAAVAARKDQPPTQSTIYKAVMTPVIFVSFLFSLAWVEFRYSMLRSHSHDHGPAGNGSAESASGQGGQRLPSWLHHLIYRRQPYQYVVVKNTTAGKTDKEGRNSSAAPAHDDDNTYYHSMQRKLLKMETTEAFRIRGTVLFVMGLIAAGGVWAVGVAVGWIAGRVWAWRDS